MNNIVDFIRAIFSDQPTNLILFLLILLPAAQWLTGVLRAIANKTFSFELLDTFLRTDLAGRIIPLIILILTGRTIDVAAADTVNIPGLDLSIVTGGGIAAAVVYLAVVVKRLIDNVNPSSPDSTPTE